MKISFPKKKDTQFVLLGSGYDLCKISDQIIEKGFKNPIIVTHQKKLHNRDNRLLKKYGHHIDIFSYAKNMRLEIIEEDNLEKDSLIKKLLERGGNMVFSHACRSIIKKKFLKSFDNLVFNIHPSFLPQERGAATYSWRILNGQNFVAATIHQMDEGIDSGPILFQKKIMMKKKKMIPLDYDVYTSDVYKIVFKQFLKLFDSKKNIVLKKQNEKHSSYLPRLYTEVNGAIDFNWKNTDIEKFVRAFSYPYTGAFTFVKEKRVSILECDIEKSDIKFHPYVSGRVNKIFSDGTIRVITTGGYIKIKKIMYKNKILEPNELIKINDVLYTPKAILDTSRQKTFHTKNMK